MTENLTTSDLVNNVANDLNGTGITKTQIKDVIDATLASVGKALKEGNEVRLHNFGSFSITDRPERPGRNPATGAEMTIAASKAVKFKASKALKDKVA